MDEFNLIDAYFNWGNSPSDVAVPVGDDAAVINIPAHQQLVISVDTFISGVHFPENTPTKAIGHKALAVNLSDLAAMGANPKWFTLALTLPEVDKNWLAEFTQGLKLLADEHHCYLVGGDTTRGPLSITIQVMGLVDKGKVMLRSGAKAGDKIYVTGTLGDAALGLQQPDNKFCKQRLDYPTPRVAESTLIKDYASACLDISDGLLQDLSHILKASNVGANLNLQDLPLSPSLSEIDRSEALQYALKGGDDYELLFTIPESKQLAFEEKCQKVGGVYINSAQHKYYCIGTISAQSSNIRDEKKQTLNVQGYNHFNGSTMETNNGK